MILGEIYKNELGTIFAYRGEWYGGYTHYACRLNDYTIKVYGHDLCSGEIGNSSCRLATEEDRKLFFKSLKRHGYTYSVCNRKIIKLNKEE